MKKFIKALLLISLIISIVWCVFNVSYFLCRKDWVAVTATITFVGLPDGIVTGMYTDINGNVHNDVPLYINYFHQGYNAEVDNLIGKEVEIVYNPLTGEIDRNNSACACISVIYLMLTVILIIFLIIRNRK